MYTWRQIYVSSISIAEVAETDAKKKPRHLLNPHRSYNCRLDFFGILA